MRTASVEEFLDQREKPNAGILNYLDFAMADSGLALPRSLWVPFHLGYAEN